MKKLGKIVLTGALTLGALATTELIKPSTQAAAATKASDPLNDEWGITNTHILYEFISPFTANLASQIQNGYDFNNKFHMELASTPSRPGTPDDQVKIFRVLQDGSLARYLTMNPTYKEKNGVIYQNWDTTINAAYPPGFYVIIGYINGKHMKSEIMPFNQ
ncbi:DUF5065 family protein [Bacillus toyonensis]|uniref:DUF5065 family protein n=1 Tax=Bacillus toyonensis TaxID=155322 RepID=UPI001CD3B535|nr:DUF5065 family protein [Bacillus toyonensis]MCA1047042.1 DUF5065 family protein [Bacillus toyonensis]